MASSVYVVDSTFQKTLIKVTPGTYLREVLEEACRKKKLNPESYLLKVNDGKKTLDLSQPFRLSGLASGARLQLVQGSRSASVVNVALQLPESEGGRRLQDKFPSTTSLWLVLRKFEDAVAGGVQSQKLNITQRATPSNVGSGAGRLEYEQPCLNVMGRTLESFTDLQKTLAQIGVSGSTMMRLTYKPSGKPLEEAMQEIGQYFSDAESVHSTTGSGDGAHATPVNGTTSIPDTTTGTPDVPLGGDAGQDPVEPRDVPMEDGPTAEVSKTCAGRTASLDRLHTFRERTDLMYLIGRRKRRDSILLIHRSPALRPFCSASSERSRSSSSCIKYRKWHRRVPSFHLHNPGCCSCAT